MQLSIIIVNYNTKKLIVECLQSLMTGYKRMFTTGKFEAIVVDNASTDGSSKLLSSYKPVKLIQNKRNVGFAKANNQAIKQARGQVILLLNPDTIVYKKTLTRLLKYIRKHKSVGIVTPKVILPTGSIDDASHRGFPTPWRALTFFLGLGKILPFTQLFNGYHLGYRKLTKIHEIDACAGACMMVLRVAGSKVKWFDEDYFWYGEDLDFCYRIKQAGYKVMYVPDVTIFHYKGAASGLKKHSRAMSKISKSTRRKIVKSRFDVMRIFYRKHYSKLYPRWLTGVVMLGVKIIETIERMRI